MDIGTEGRPVDSPATDAATQTDVSRRLFLGGIATAAAASVAGEARAQAPELVNVEAFISGVRAARVFDLGFTWDQSSPVLSLNPPYAFALNATVAVAIDSTGATASVNPKFIYLLSGVIGGMGNFGVAVLN